MGEPGTYSLIDLMPMEPEVYLRLFVRQNLAVWPSQAPALMLGVAALWAGRHNRNRIAGLSIGACWVWVGATFHLNLYAELNWAAVYTGWAFIVQGVMLALSGFVADPVRRPHRPPAVVHCAGASLGVFALVVYPVMTVLGERSWRGVELLGIAPDPTALATLGLLLMLNRPVWPFVPIPVLWCVYSGLTWYAMRWYPGLAVSAAAIVFMIAGVAKSLAGR